MEEIGRYDPRQLSLAGWTSVVITYQILVIKLSEIRLIVTPGKEKIYHLFLAPLSTNSLG